MKAYRHLKRRILSGSIFVLGGTITSIMLVVTTLCLVALSLLNPALMGKVQAGVISALSPVLNSISAPVQTFAIVLKNAGQYASLKTENEALRAENAKLTQWYIFAKTLTSENADLKTLLNYKLEPAPEMLTTSVLVDTGSPFAKSVLVKAGKQHGLQTGAPVLGPHGVVGIVVDAMQDTSRILLMTDLNARIPVLIESHGQMIHAVLAGYNAARPRLLYLPKGTLLEEGAHIITSGKGGVFPYGLAVGSVRHVLSQQGAADSFEVDPYSQLDQLQFVRVIQATPEPVFIPEDTSDEVVSPIIHQAQPPAVIAPVPAPAPAAVKAPASLIELSR